MSGTTPRLDETEQKEAASQVEGVFCGFFHLTVQPEPSIILEDSHRSLLFFRILPGLPSLFISGRKSARQTTRQLVSRFFFPCQARSFQK